MKVQVFPYKVIGEKPITDLIEFKEHRRLRVFYHKGTTCVTCGKVGTRLILGQQFKTKQEHWDIYTEDLYPITVDHIIPKSLGGSDELENLQPMCSGCNSRKGNGRNSKTREQKKLTTKGATKLSNINSSDIIGKLAYRKSGKSRQLKPIGFIAGTLINPHTNKLSAYIADKPNSYYHLDSLYTL